MHQLRWVYYQIRSNIAFLSFRVVVVTYIMRTHNGAVAVLLAFLESSRATLVSFIIVFFEVGINDFRVFGRSFYSRLKPSVPGSIESVVNELGKGRLLPYRQRFPSRLCIVESTRRLGIRRADCFLVARRQQSSNW